jgi:hypothetical protein
MLYLIKITWFFLPFIVIVALSFTSNESWQIVALAFPLMELMISEDFWLYMAEDIVPKFIKDPNDKVKKVVSSNLNKMKIKRLLYYVGIYISIYFSEQCHLFHFIVKVLHDEKSVGLNDNFIYRVFNRILFISFITYLVHHLTESSNIKEGLQEVKEELYDKIYDDVLECNLVLPVIVEKIGLSISSAHKIEPKLLVKNMEDLPKETTVFIEKVNKIKKTCNVVVVMPDLTIHSGIVKFEPK